MRCLRNWLWTELSVFSTRCLEAALRCCIGNPERITDILRSIRTGNAPKGENKPYGLDEVLKAFGLILAKDLKQIYDDPSNHSREVWQYVQKCSIFTASPRRDIYIWRIISLRIKQMKVRVVQKLREVWRSRTRRSEAH